MRIFILPVITALSLGASASASSLWAGAEISTTGYGGHAGLALLPIPFVGTIGVEGNYELLRDTNNSRFGVGITARDINIPLSNVDVFASAGLVFNTDTQIYAEAGLRVAIAGPIGWRAYVKANSITSEAKSFGAGIGLEVNF